MSRSSLFLLGVTSVVVGGINAASAFVMLPIHPGVAAINIGAAVLNLATGIRMLSP